MNCMNPNCECKPGTFANMNPPKAPVYEGFGKFNPQMIADLEWQKTVSVNTKSGKYRVEITWALDRYRVSVYRRVQEPEKPEFAWALDRYRVSVYRRVQEPEKLVEVRHPKFAHTAVVTANKMLRNYERNGY